MTVGAIGNHLWQSTLFAVALAIISLGLRQHRASIRHRLWTIASIKFLVPFGVLERVGMLLPLQPWMPPPSTADTRGSVEVLIEPFGSVSTSLMRSPSLTPANDADWMYALIWSIGCSCVVATWAVQWIALRRVASSARPLAGEWDVPVKVCNRGIEPGVFGVFRPVVLLPAPIVGGLAPSQLTAVIAHEQCHIERRDNLIMTLHMVVEAVYWFHPLVWWIERRLVAERERACDEQVIARGQDASTYATAILKVCELALSPSLPCMSRITRIALQRRIESIMTRSTFRELNRWQRRVLAGITVLVIVGPVIVGARVAAHHSALAQAASTTQPVSSAALAHWIGTWQMDMSRTRIPDPGGTGVGPNIYADGFYTIEIAALASGLRVTHMAKMGAPAQAVRHEIIVPFDGRPVDDLIEPRRTWSFRTAGATAFDLIRTTRQGTGATQVVAQHYEFADEGRTLTWTWRADNPAPAWRIATLVFEKAK